jgi:hypothetical protein
MSVRLINIDGAPLMLWAAIIAGHLGIHREEALTVGKAIAGLGVRTKADCRGRRLRVAAKPSTVVATGYVFDMRSRTDLKLETKRASVSDVAPRGSITSISENCPRLLTARSSAAVSSRRVLARSPTPPIGAAKGRNVPIADIQTPLLPTV